MMSRHILTPRPGQPEIVAIVVGWDRPLQTFFAQVFARTEAEPDEGEATIWVGTEPGELATPEAAIAVIAPFADVPDTLASLPDAEMRAGRDSADGGLQFDMKRRPVGAVTCIPHGPRGEKRPGG